MPKHGVAFEETLRYINFIRRLHCKGCSEYKEEKICKSENECLKKDILCLIENAFANISKKSKMEKKQMKLKNILDTFDKNQIIFFKDEDGKILANATVKAIENGNMSNFGITVDSEVSSVMIFDGKVIVEITKQKESSSLLYEMNRIKNENQNKGMDTIFSRRGSRDYYVMEKLANLQKESRQE